MPMDVRDSIEIIDNTRMFDSRADELYTTNWQFRYVTQNMQGEDQTVHGGVVDGNKINYPAGTIFFDTEPTKVTHMSTIRNIYIDSTPPEFVSENIQYMVFGSDYNCEFTFKSDIPVDVAQLIISCGDVLFSSLRNGGIEDTGNIKDIYITKNDDLYTVSFKIDKAFDVDDLNEHQITIIIWDLAGNYVSYTTAGTWIYLDNNIDDEHISPLNITLLNSDSITYMVTNDSDNNAIIKVTNPNKFLWEITPTVKTDAGIIKNVSYDKNEGVLVFTVNGIYKNGMIHVEAWIAADNRDIYESLKNETYADIQVGPFIVKDPCREYNFSQYTTKAMKGEHYGQFIEYCQDMMNSCQYSLSTGNRISTLEKIARINDFNDIDKMESQYLEYMRDQFNYEVTPNLKEYLYYLNNVSVSGGMEE